MVGAECASFLAVVIAAKGVVGPGRGLIQNPVKRRSITLFEGIFLPNVLEEAAQRLQILILTCHPERYRGLKRAAFFDLESSIASATSSGQRH